MKILHNFELKASTLAPLRKASFGLLLLLLFFSPLLWRGAGGKVFSQTPQSFKYQSVVRDGNGVLAVNKIISIRTSMLAGSTTGSSVYTETQTLSTNDYGVVSLNIGAGTLVSGNFSTINWGATIYFVKTELDINGGSNYIFMGTSQILSVPYALYAEKAGNALADHDTSATNEIQTLSVTGNNLSISNGNTIALPPDADSNPTNEFQNLSVTGHTVSISNGNSVSFPPDTLVVIGNTLSISNGNTITLPPDADNNPANELQNLSIVGDSMHITSGNSVYLSGAIDLDASPTNELQNLSLNNDTLKMSMGNYVVLPPDGDNNSTNEIQTISISNDSIKLSKNGGFILLPPVQSHSLQLNTGIGTNGNLSSSGNATISGTKNYINFHLHFGDTLFISNTTMIKVKDSCIIEGVIMGKGRSFTPNNNTLGGSGGGGGGLQYSHINCYNNFFTSASNGGSTNGVSFDQFAPLLLPGGIAGIKSNLVDTLTKGGNGQSYQTNLYDLALSYPVLPYLNGQNGGKNLAVWCPSIMKDGGIGGAGIYLISKYFSFTGIINLEGDNGKDCLIVSMNSGPCGSSGYAIPSTVSGGGSGGGAGGVAIIRANNIITNTGTILNNGGMGGLGSNSSFTQISPACTQTIIGSNGGNGGNGGYKIIIQ